MSGLALAATGVVALVGARLKISSWHSREAGYWAEVSSRVQSDPSLDAHYQSLLAWKQQHRTTGLRCLLPWRNPEDRRSR